MNSIKVSIIVPVYNVEKYFSRCMNSLLNQTLHDIEIILVDDGSPDRCPDMCDEYARKDSRIRVIHKKNGGLGYARNSGIEVARGEYIAFVDSDDYVDVRMYEQLYTAMDGNQYDAILSNFFRVRSSGDISINREVTEKLLFDTKERMYSLLMNMIATPPECDPDRIYSISVWRGIYKTSVIRNASISFVSERECLSEDMPFHVSFLSCANTAAYLPEAFYYYCDNPGSLTNVYREGAFEKIKCLVNLVRQACKHGFPANHSDIDQRLNRLFFSYVRSVCLNRNVPLRTMRLIFSDSDLRKSIREYRFGGMSYRYRIYSLLMYHRLALPLKLIGVLMRRVR